MGEPLFCGGVGQLSIMVHLIETLCVMCCLLEVGGGDMVMASRRPVRSVFCGFPDSDHNFM